MEVANRVALDQVELAAWAGFLRAHAELVRRLDDELQRAHRLPLTSYDVLVQLANAPDGRLRMAELADAIVLSRSGLPMISRCWRRVAMANAVKPARHNTKARR